MCIVKTASVVIFKFNSTVDVKFAHCLQLHAVIYVIKAVFLFSLHHFLERGKRLALSRFLVKNTFFSNIKQIQGGDHEVISYGNFKEFLNHTLNVSQVLASIYVEDFVECTFQCIATLGCFSFNIATVSSINPNNRSCDLLSTDKYYNSSNFVPSQEFDHYAIAVC